MEPELAAPAEPIVSAPEAAPSAPAAPAAPEPAAAPSAPLERREVIRAAIQASKEPADGKTLRERMIANGTIRPSAQGDRQRAPDGKFVPHGAPTAPKPAVAAPAAPQTPAQAIEALPLPKSLKKELEAHWKAANPELQRAIQEREAAFERGVVQYRTKAQEAEALLGEFKPYEQIMRMTGGTPVSAIRNILPTMAVLNTGSPQEKAFVIARAMQSYGIPIEHIAQVMQNGVQSLQGQPGGQMDPAVQQLAQQVQQLTQVFQSNQQAAQAADDARLSAIADAFGRDKPNFDTLRPQMWSLLQAQSAAEEKGLTGPLGSREQTSVWAEQQWIENAYNAALRLSPDLYQSELARNREEAARQERERATQAAQAARAASVQVRGAPAPAAMTQQINPRDRRAVIAAAMRGIPR